MEIKHTIEILTKDIQDIEKLVRNLNKYKTPPQIELDLAMSKLRRVYELLTMISSDSKNELEDPVNTVETAGVKKDNEISQVNIPDNNSEDISKDIPEDIPEDISEPTTVDSNPMKVDINKEAEIENIIEEEKEDQLENIPDEEPQVERIKPKETSILAERFGKDKSLNEKIAPTSHSDLSTKIKGGPIDSIKRNIGINDRFLIIRELLNGDSEAFSTIIQKLDECNNFNEAFSHIQTRFPDHLEHEGVKILINLTRRKFISSGNI